jgi:hypothetical protein
VPWGECPQHTVTAPFAHPGRVGPWRLDNATARRLQGSRRGTETKQGNIARVHIIGEQHRGGSTRVGDTVAMSTRNGPGATDEAIQRVAQDFASGDQDGDETPEAQPINVVVLVPSTHRADSGSSLPTKRWTSTRSGP